MLLIGISCAWIIGIWLGSAFAVPILFIVSAVLPVPFLFVFKRHRRTLVLLMLSLIFFFTGAWLSPVLNHQYNSVAAFTDRGKIEFTGIISGPPEQQDSKSRVIISVREVNGYPVYGKVLYSSYSYANLKYGDLIKGQGAFQVPHSFEDFDYRSYLAGEGIYAILQEMDYHVIQRSASSPLMAWIFDLRERLADNLASALPEPQASLCQGIVLGLRNNISQDLTFDLSVSGTAHLLAISGQNLTIITGLLLALGLFLFGRRYYLYIWLTLVIIWFYALFTGLQAPVIRSAIMASLFLFAEILGRQKNAFPALAFGAAIMIALSPPVLHNLSFQLSFMAMAGLIFITPVLGNWGRKVIFAKWGEESFWSRPLVFVTDSFSVSLGAVIAIWPIISYTFGITSFVGPLTTFLISPALTPIIIFGTLTALAGLFSPAVAQIIGWVAWLFLSYMIVIAGIFAVLPAAYIKNRTFNPHYIWLYYALFLLLINTKAVVRIFRSNWFRAVRSGFLDWTISAGVFIGQKAAFIMPPLMILAVLTSLAAVTLPERNLKVSFLDVGEGDSILIQDDGQNILIDGGPGGGVLCNAISQKLPFWERRIDLVILTHSHLDHLAGLLEVLKRYRVEKVLASPISSDSPSYRQWLALIKTKKIEYLEAQTGQRFFLSHGAVLDILNPPQAAGADAAAEPDQNAVVARLSCGPGSLLFTSDIGSETETRLLRERLVQHADILKIAHHGSNTSSSVAFLKAVSPSLAVISAGADNRFGHPDPAVIETIAASGVKTVFRTDVNGTITFDFDFERATVYFETEH
jgi:competence protein ComEC